MTPSGKSFKEQMGFTPLPQVKQAQSGFDTDPQKEANSKCKNLWWKCSASTSQMLNLQGWTQEHIHRFQLLWKCREKFSDNGSMTGSLKNHRSVMISIKKYQESKHRFWRTILLLLLSSVIAKFRIGSFTHTSTCVGVYRYI